MPISIPSPAVLLFGTRPRRLIGTSPNTIADTTAAREFLAHAGARSVTVPYRSNRAVIFDSDLFHETDRIVFKEGYLNRRINITLLYGLRETATNT